MNNMIDDIFDFKNFNYLNHFNHKKSVPIPLINGKSFLKEIKEIREKYNITNKNLLLEYDKILHIIRFNKYLNLNFYLFLNTRFCADISKGLI